MAEPFFVKGPERGRRVADLFGTIAPSYDLINDLQSFGFHRLWKRRVIEWAAPKPGELALDVCAGTGDLTLGLAKHGAISFGLDFSQEMLSRAQKRAARDEIGRVGFVLGNAMQLPFENAVFGIVTIGYGLRNLAGVPEGLAEMWRVLRAGGRLLILELGQPSAAWWRAVFYLYLRAWVPLYGLIFHGNPQLYAYLLTSLKQYVSLPELRTLLEGLGAREVRVRNFLGGGMTLVSAVKPAPEK